MKTSVRIILQSFANQALKKKKKKSEVVASTAALPSPYHLVVEFELRW